jgi:hypothetical protein
MPALIEENVVRLIKELECDECSLEIVLFLWRHPGEKFNGKQLAEGISLPLLDVIRAVGFLINREMVSVTRKNNLLYYALTKDRSVRAMVMALSNIGKIEWQVLMEQIACDYYTTIRMDSKVPIINRY